MKQLVSFQGLSFACSSEAFYELSRKEKLRPAFLRISGEKTHFV